MIFHLLEFFFPFSMILLETSDELGKNKTESVLFPRWFNKIYFHTFNTNMFITLLGYPENKTEINNS